MHEPEEPTPKRRDSRARRATGPREGPSPDFREALLRLDRELGEALLRHAEENGDGWFASLWAIAEGLAGSPAGRFAQRIAALNDAPRADDFGLQPEILEEIAPFFEFLYHRWWRVEMRGLERVPAEGAALLVANHSGGMLPWDGAMLKLALKREHSAKRELRPLVDDFVFALPFLGSWMSRCGGVRASRENAEILLERGEVVGVFPEGVRGLGKPFAKRYQLERFGRGGFIRLAAATGAPIFPVAIVGAEEIHPMIGKIERPARMLGLPYLPITPTFPWLGLLGLVPLPTRWTIQVGEPFDVRARVGRKRRTLPTELVDELAQEVRGTVQSMIDELCDERASIF